VTHFVALSFAEHMGWDPILDWSMMGNGLSVEALHKGYVDAFIAPELHTTMAVAAGFKVLVDLGEYKFRIAGSAFLVNREWLKDNWDTAGRLAALVPRPRLNLTRFHGVFAPNCKHRTKIVPRRHCGTVDSDKPIAPMSWMQRLKRVFTIDIAKRCQVLHCHTAPNLPTLSVH